MNQPTARLAGLYAITPADITDPARLADKVAAALRGGARLIQYRDKSTDHARRRATAERLLALTRAHGARLIINDDVALAAAVGADGVHLGRDDMSLAQARAALGPAAVIGVSCYDRFERAQQAAAQGADYVAFGRFFPSTTKPDAVPAAPALLRRARAELGLPVAAIGGINAENGADLIAAGADLLAVVEAVFGAADVEAAARGLSGLFSRR